MDEILLTSQYEDLESLSSVNCLELSRERSYIRTLLPQKNYRPPYLGTCGLGCDNAWE